MWVDLHSSFIWRLLFYCIYALQVILSHPPADRILDLVFDMSSNAKNVYSHSQNYTLISYYCRMTNHPGG